MHSRVSRSILSPFHSELVCLFGVPVTPPTTSIRVPTDPVGLDPLRPSYEGIAEVVRPKARGPDSLLSDDNKTRSFALQQSRSRVSFACMSVRGVLEASCSLRCHEGIVSRHKNDVDKIQIYRNLCVYGHSVSTDAISRVSGRRIRAPGPRRPTLCVGAAHRPTRWSRSHT